MKPIPVTHGGTDALGVPAHDFSTNRNAFGPCPQALDMLAQAHAAQYPDPHYTALRARLADFHCVPAERIVIAASASDFIHRITMHAAREGAAVASLPAHHYGDYAHAAQVWRLHQAARDGITEAGPGLHWACAPSSPLGQPEDVWPLWSEPAPPGTWRVIDCAYAPLRLEPGMEPAVPSQVRDAWQMWTPNKALGMTGVRAAYAIAPEAVPHDEIDALRALSPSWPVGAHGEAMLTAWTAPATRQWLAQSLQRLRDWKAQQLDLVQRLGWQVLPGSQANYFVARWPQAQQGDAMQTRLAQLRAQGIKLRDCDSFGLPGCVRMGVLAPASQNALLAAWQPTEKHHAIE
ncbi:aminotransferase class I/II-fold pyridoxal phosphate-dependent enzyme [Delftia acidovorans]|uniref:aminotransferase class I/II-fold pyridoxal phosphate-dependent enzyme n=1 Tax=Delftia acidovorans TaxID=80866 RepID=UPI001EE068E1|nr:aminotransferase class I/II-fold pyridoxal phosphate-dependent enzyme [Delftia acidovorans]MCG3784047.1 aminotransferase class I/II-fold pyridoxal phosphate-dependent enzyme [Delftia acidovorans]